MKTYSTSTQQISPARSENAADLANLLSAQRGKSSRCGVDDLGGGFGSGGRSGGDWVGNKGEDGDGLGDGGELHFGCGWGFGVIWRSGGSGWLLGLLEVCWSGLLECDVDGEETDFERVEEGVYIFLLEVTDALLTRF